MLALVQRAILERLPLPGAAISGTPWSDLTETGDSYATNRYNDSMVYSYLLGHAARQNANGLSLKDNRASPFHGSFATFPPGAAV